jgi:DNA-directed RNA polymerase subunit RPC12/RpoP
MDNLDYCYWIAVPGRMARIDCNHEMINLPKSRDLPESMILDPYIHEPCPYCGKRVMIDAHSYDLIKETS